MVNKPRQECNERLTAGWGYARPPEETQGDYFLAWVATLVNHIAAWAGDEILDPSRLKDRLAGGGRPGLPPGHASEAPLRRGISENLQFTGDLLGKVGAGLGLPDGVADDQVWSAMLLLLENVEEGLGPIQGSYLEALFQKDAQEATVQSRDEARDEGENRLRRARNPRKQRKTGSTKDVQQEERHAFENSSAASESRPTEAWADQDRPRPSDALGSLRADVSSMATTVDKQLKAFASDLRKLKTQWAASAEELTSRLSGLSDSADSRTHALESIGRKLAALQRSSDAAITEQRTCAAAVQQASETNFEKWAKHTAEVDQRLERLEHVLANRVEVEHLDRYEAVRKTIESMVVDRVRRELAHTLKALLLQLQHAAKSGDLDGVQALAAEVDKRMIVLGLR